jgi:hypothetical protein
MFRYFPHDKIVDSLLLHFLGCALYFSLEYIWECFELVLGSIDIPICISSLFIARAVYLSFFLCPLYNFGLRFLRSCIIPTAIIFSFSFVLQVMSSRRTRANPSEENGEPVPVRGNPREHDKSCDSDSDAVADDDPQSDNDYDDVVQPEGDDVELEVDRNTDPTYLFYSMR